MKAVREPSTPPSASEPGERGTRRTETIEGAEWVEDMHVHKWFSDLWGGRRDAKHIKTNFETSLAYCADLGSVRP